MFFSEREKQIYEAPSGQKYDPLRVDRLLVIETGGKLDEWIIFRNVGAGGGKLSYTGDVGRGGRVQAVLLAAEAELALAVAARKVFGIPDFPAAMDAEALETLYHFLAWMEGKGETAGTPQSTLTTDCELSVEPTPSGLPSA